MREARAFGVLPLLLTACGGALAVPPPPVRSEAPPLILAEVLTYELHQFGQTVEGPLEVCVSVREDDDTKDPSEAVMRRLPDRKDVKPQSACRGQAAIALVAGPIEWLAADEVRVRGSYTRRALRASTSLTYRVVWEGGRWACLGPIVALDPL
jgi:hypothetical protein